MGSLSRTEEQRVVANRPFSRVARRSLALALVSVLLSLFATATATITLDPTPTLAQERASGRSARARRAARRRRRAERRRAAREARRAEKRAAEASENGTETSGSRAEHSPEPDAPAGSEDVGAQSEVVEEGGSKVKAIRFTGLDVSGRLKSPQLLYFLNRLRAEFDRPRLPHRSFLPELERSSHSKSF